MTWHRLHVLVTRDDYEWLRREAFLRRTSIGEVVRALLTQAQANQKGNRERSDTAAERRRKA